MEGQPGQPRWTIIVLRAWAESGGARIRVLRHDSTGREAQGLVASPQDAGELVVTWLEDLLADLPLDHDQDASG